MASKYVEHESKSMQRFMDIASEPRRMLAPIKGYEKVRLVTLEEAVDPLVSYVSEVKRMVWTVKQNCVSPADGLTTDQSASIMLYSFEWTPREDSFYIVFNKVLRAEDRNKLKPWFLYLKLLVTSLSKLPSIHCTVYRGVKQNLHGLYREGSTFVWWGFSSCTSSVKVLQSEEFLGKTGFRTMFNIECHSGKDIRRHSFYSTENEVLLPAGRQFQVDSCLDSGNGLHIVQLKEIEPPFPLLEPVSALNRPCFYNSLV
jgi:hypothetical protein